jgi:hypothetical protein
MRAPESGCDPMTTTRGPRSSRGVRGRVLRTLGLTVLAEIGSSPWRRQWRVVVGTADDVDSGKARARGEKGSLK